MQCRRPGLNPWVGKIPWRREWLSTPVFLPGKSYGQRSLAGYSPWCHKELDTTEWLTYITCHSSKQGCHSHQRLQPSYMSWWALRGLRKEKNTCSLAAIRLQQFPKVSPEEMKLRMWKYGIMAPGYLRCLWRECLHWAQILASSHTQTSTKFLNLGYLVFLQ